MHRLDQRACTRCARIRQCSRVLEYARRSQLAYQSVPGTSRPIRVPSERQWNLVTHSLISDLQCEFDGATLAMAR